MSRSIQTIFFCIAIAVLAAPAACASGAKDIPEPPLAAAKSVSAQFLRSEPAGAKPGWVDTTPKSDTELFFVGVSRGFATAADARSAAREDSFNQIVKYYGEYIQATGRTKTISAGLSTETLDPFIMGEEEITSFAQAVVSQVAADKYYTEVYLADKQEEYIVYVLAQIPRQKAQADIENFAKNISERYTNLIGSQNTLTSGLKLYGDIYESLRINPLHQAVAYYDSPSGRVGLFDYARLQINTIAGSVSFDLPPSLSVQKGQTLNTVIKLSSPLFKTIGNASCRLNIAGGKITIPSVAYTVGNDNGFLLQIHTNNIDAGNYTVQLELSLNEFSTAVSRNPKSGFSFSVTSLNTAQIRLLNDEAGGIAGKVRQIVQDNGLLLVESGGAYLLTIKFDANETQTANYVNVQPTVTIIVELERDGTPIVTYSKNYPQFRHVTKAEAYNRAYRNIENDLGGDFAEQVRIRLNAP